MVILKKVLIFLEFGKGLFDFRNDFDASDDVEPYVAPKKSQKQDAKLKEIEIKSAMFNSVPEDLFFSLD
jgi:hypothetical protein